ncbi:MAG: radical SAM protein [Oscillospiraceae bacterium]|nr:radical SAM protein [Oscillospiraceae bacterium]
MEAVNMREMPPSRALTDFLYRKASHLRIPLSGTFELSPVCNFSCRMCYVRKTREEVRNSPRKIMTLEDWLRIAREAREEGMLYLLLTGGEPLLWPDFWTLYDALIDMGFLISINTNGSLIDEAAIAHFRKKPPQRINITLYGAGDGTYQNLCGIRGVFTKVDAAIRGLKEAGVTVKLNCSLTPENAADLDWIIDYAQARDVVVSVATYMFPPVRRDPERFGVNERFTPEESAAYLMRYLRRDRGEEAYQHYLKGILDGFVEPPGLDESCVDPVDGQIRCRAGKASFWITWDGWLTPCGMMPEPKVDLKTEPFAGAWKALTELAAGLRLSGVCDKCANKDICHPCAAIAYAETGSSSGIPTYMCRATREMCRVARETLGSEM